MTFDFGGFPILKTPRLHLREIVPSDIEAIFAIRGNYEVTKYNSGVAYTDMQQADDLIAGIADEYQRHGSVRWGIALKPADTIIGMCGYNYWHRDDHRASIGFDLNQAYWRRGIMAEAVRCMMRFGFTQMHLNRIEADCSAENVASAALLRKLGFRPEGRQHQQYFEAGAYHDLLLYALLHEEWKNQNG